jgi:hypothetical protein
MYTQLDDQRKANFIKQYLETHPNCTRKELVQETVTTWTRLQSLERQGYYKLPKIVPYGERNGFFRKSC